MKSLKKIPIFIVKFYQYVISPYCPGCCRFTPTCSNYAIQAFNKYGMLKALGLSVRRIMRCFPGGGKGFDPLP